MFIIALLLTFAIFTENLLFAWFSLFVTWQHHRSYEFSSHLTIILAEIILILIFDSGIKENMNLLVFIFLKVNVKHKIKLPCSPAHNCSSGRSFYNILYHNYLQIFQIMQWETIRGNAAVFPPKYMVKCGVNGILITWTIYLFILHIFTHLCPQLLVYTQGGQESRFRTVSEAASMLLSCYNHFSTKSEAIWNPLNLSTPPPSYTNIDMSIFVFFLRLAIEQGGRNTHSGRSRRPGRWVIQHIIHLQHYLKTISIYI